MSARDYLSAVYLWTGIVLVDDTGRVTGLPIDAHAREMCLTYRMLGYGPRQAAHFLRRYYLLSETE